MLSDDRFIELFELQHDLQTNTYGYNFQQMTLIDRIQYVKNMKLALEAELQEALDETQWKPWTNHHATIKWVNRDAYVGEMVDVLHFLINMLLVLGDDPKDLAIEVANRYLRKHDINKQRQVDGYDGVSTKCGGCGRALDDPAVACTRKGDQGFCAHIISDINYIKSTFPTIRDTVEP